MDRWSPAQLVTLVVLMGLATLAWSPGLGDGAWIDEVISLETAALPWDALVARSGFGDVHPPGYYGTLKVWLSLAGGSDLAGRGLSLLLALVALGVLFNHLRSGGLVLRPTLAIALVVCAPLGARYATEIRSYGLLMLLSTLALVTFERASERRQPRRSGWSGSAVAAALVMTHYAGWILCALVAASTWLRLPGDRASGRRWTQGWLVVLVPVALWLPMVLVQTRHLPEGVTAHLDEAVGFMEMVLAFSPAGGAGAGWLALGAGCLVLAGCLGAIGAERALPSVEPDPPPTPEVGGFGKIVALLVLTAMAPLMTLAFVPMSELLLDLYIGELPRVYMALSGAAMITVIGGHLRHRIPGPVRWSLPTLVLVGGVVFMTLLALVRPLGTVRNLIIFLPFVAVLVARLVGSRGPRVQLVCVLVVGSLGALSLPTLGDRFEPRPDLRGAAQTVAEGASVVVWPRWDAPGIAHHGVETPTGILSDGELPVPDGDRWEVILTREAIAEPEPYERRVLSWLGRGWRQVDRWEGRGVIRLRYERDSPP